MEAPNRMSGKEWGSAGRGGRKVESELRARGGEREKNNVRENQGKD